MPNLNGGSTPVRLGRGVIVQAPGIVGTVDLLPPGLFGVRAGEEPVATPALAGALADHGFETAHSLQLVATPLPGAITPPVRGADQRPSLVLEVPDLGAHRTQVVLLTDETGVVSWHYPQPTGALRAVRFVVPADAVATAADRHEVPDRGFVAAIGKKLLSVLVFPLLDPLVRRAAQAVASRWEATHRPIRLRLFGPENYLAPDGPTVIGAAWSELSGPTLLFLHGTFSTSVGGFGALPCDVLSQLHKQYERRTIAFDHPTLSVDPLANVDSLVALVPPGIRLSVDIVAHSRGGLVARALAAAGEADPLFPIAVRRIVYVGTPNAGTALTDAKHLAEMLDRVSTMLNLVPDGPWSVVTDVLDGVLTVVQVLAQGATGGLPGLQAMDPAGEWLPTLGARAQPRMEQFGINADFEPDGGLLRLLRLGDTIVDRVFSKLANDVIVPSDAVFHASGAAGLPVPPENRLSFAGGHKVWHCSYFSQPETGEHLKRWLK